METTISINGNERIEVVWAGDKTTATNEGTKLLNRGFAVKVYDSGFGIWVAEGVKMINQPETEAQRTVYDVVKIAGMFYTETELEILNNPIVWNEQTGVQYMETTLASNINPAISISKADYTNTYYYFWIDNTIMLEIVLTQLGSQIVNWAADAPQVWQDNFDMAQAWRFINEYNLRTQMMA